MSSDDVMSADFASELDYMILENVYFDLWARTDVLDRRTRSVVTLGLLFGLTDETPDTTLRCLLEYEFR